MNKLGIVLGAAAVAFIAGCMDPNYVPPSKRGQNDVKPAGGAATPVLTPDVKPVADEELPGYPGTDEPAIDISVAPVAGCQCPPGAVHDGPCNCGAPDCTCTVTPPPPPPVVAPVEQVALPGEPVAQSDDTTTVYYVRPGDTLSIISRRFNIKLDSIRKANPQLKGDVIHAGQKLTLPVKVDLGEYATPVSVPQPPPQEFVPYNGPTTQYVVKNGDCLSVLARKNGITTKQLKVLNGLTDNNIRIGQKLLLPATAGSAAVEPAPAKQEKPVVKPVVKEEKKVVPPPAKVEVVEPQPPVIAEPEIEDIPVVEAVVPVEEVKDVPAAPAPAVEPNGDYISYVVMKGEDITALSISFGIDPSVIRELNNMGDNDQLVPGQTIRLPAEAQ